MWDTSPDMPHIVPGASQGVQVSKSSIKNGLNHDFRMLDFGYMATLVKMVKILLYQLEILSIFCFIGRWPTWTLEASADPSFSALIFPLKPLSVRQP